ncbi:C-type lectin domain family 4 member E-like [Saccostrea cucullata]|uniref:C-type lectin domain family 4 member E-like n=1 Tax=Saccostrea cuccullata TaxID=36930 RepID=UPI002ED349C9
MKFNLILLISVVLIEGAECCLPGWMGYGNKCYFFNSMPKEWGVASAYCHAMSAKLAEPRTGEEGHFLTSHAQKVGGNFWIGITDLIEEDMWMYASTQEPFNMTSSLWSANEPNGYTTSNCGLLMVAYHSKLADYNCVYKEKSICELSEFSYK